MADFSPKTMPFHEPLASFHAIHGLRTTPGPHFPLRGWSGQRGLGNRRARVGWNNRSEEVLADRAPGCAIRAICVFISVSYVSSCYCCWLRKLGLLLPLILLRFSIASF